MLPIGKNRLGSESRHAATSRHSVVRVRVAIRLLSVLVKFFTRLGRSFEAGVFGDAGTVVTRLLMRNGFRMEIIGETPNSLRVIGHRGWPTRYPDNVLAGILAAAAVADMVEIDIRSTGDDILILSHDSHIGGMAVAETRWADLAGFDLGEGHRPNDLKTVMSALPGFPLNLEIKNFPGENGFDPDHRLAIRTAAMARSGDLLTSFYWPTVDVVRDNSPLTSTGLLVDRGGSIADAVDHALTRGHVAVIAQFEVALRSEAAVRAAVEAGLSVAVWTLNDPSVAIRLAAMGVTAVITDDPGEMRHALRDLTVG